MAIKEIFANCRLEVNGQMVWVEVNYNNGYNLLIENDNYKFSHTITYENAKHFIEDLKKCKPNPDIMKLIKYLSKTKPL